MTPNRKIFEYNKGNISEYNMSIEKPLYQPNIPYLYVRCSFARVTG